MAKRRHTVTTHIGDYQRDPISLCSLAAQGLFRSLEFLMSDGPRYGYLTIDGLPITPDYLVRYTKGTTTPDVIASLLDELLAMSVLARTPKGLLHCPSMIERHRRAEQAVTNGRRGGNPRLKHEGVNPSVNPTLNHTLNPPLEIGDGNKEIGHQEGGAGETETPGCVDLGRGRADVPKLLAAFDEFPPDVPTVDRLRVLLNANKRFPFMTTPPKAISDLAAAVDKWGWPFMAGCVETALDNGADVPIRYAISVANSRAGREFGRTPEPIARGQQLKKAWRPG